MSKQLFPQSVSLDVSMERTLLMLLLSNLLQTAKWVQLEGKHAPSKWNENDQSSHQRVNVYFVMEQNCEKKRTTVWISGVERFQKNLTTKWTCTNLSIETKNSSILDFVLGFFSLFISYCWHSPFYEQRVCIILWVRGIIPWCVLSNERINDYPTKSCENMSQFSSWDLAISISVEDTQTIYKTFNGSVSRCFSSNWKENWQKFLKGDAFITWKRKTTKTHIFAF